MTTITRDGPGFHSYIKEYQKEGNSSSNGTSGGPADLAKLMGGPNLMDIIKQLKLNSAPKVCILSYFKLSCNPHSYKQNTFPHLWSDFDHVVM